ncbi:MAG: LysR family transcriptional regulator [Verrucomicrobiales bacterium]|nr:LysR family transcriptional regulator [Verrucomicrobiales bacterium]MCP5559034.1 LysR family transcriptional regulator [Verrucomicrobiaceae bacterium]
MHFPNFNHLRSFWVTAKAGSLRAASQRWHFSQPTLSEQIKQLEESLDTALFQKVGGRLALTEAGRRAFDYAEQIFALGSELVEKSQAEPSVRGLSLAVGVADTLPKLLSWSFIRPALNLPQPVRLICREGDVSSLLEQLTTFRLDVVLSDEAAPAHLNPPAFSQKLATSGLSFLANAALAKKLRRRYPESLDQAPIIFPARGTAMRVALDKWFHDRGLQPTAAAECDDSAMQKAAALDGVGFVAVASIEVESVRERYGFEVVGSADDCQLSFYAITAMRKIRHPAVAAILQKPIV